MYIHVKRIIDIVMLIIFCPLWIPLMLILSLMVKLFSPGPIFFKQKRIGKDGRYFMIYKFRSMYVDAPKDTPTHMLENPDKHITPIGKFLRKTSLDELPQIFNMIKREITLVGPRPALWNQDDLIAEREKYGVNNIPVGITGWAQVNGRDELPIEKKAKYDGEYARKMGFLFDIKILFLTVYCTLSRHGMKEGAN